MKKVKEIYNIQLINIKKHKDYWHKKKINKDHVHNLLEKESFKNYKKLKIIEILNKNKTYKNYKPYYNRNKRKQHNLSIKRHKNYKDYQQILKNQGNLYIYSY